MLSAHRALVTLGGRVCYHLSLLLAQDETHVKSVIMSKITPPRGAARARERIAQIRQELGAIELLCSGTLLKRMKTCGSPNCRCAHDPTARHGPYYEWGHMRAGKLVHRVVSAEQAEVLRQAIANYRRLKKLLRGWESETERLIDAAASQTT